MKKILYYIFVFLLILFIVQYLFYFGPKRLDEEVLQKIKSSLDSGDYAEVCGFYKDRYEIYESAASGNSEFFELTKNDTNFKFLASCFSWDMFWYKSKSESRFNPISNLTVGDKICVTYSTKYLEVDKSSNYRQVPLLISIK